MAWPVPTPPPTPDPNPNLQPQHPCLQFVSLKLERDQAMAVKTDLEQQVTLRKSIMVQGDLNIVERKAMLLQRKSGDVRSMLNQVSRQGVDLKI